MTTLTIEETFQVKAHVDRVWHFLLDPEQVARCLPGAALDEIEDETHFSGNMKVKVGPVTVTYKGSVELTEIDEESYHIQMVGKGKEKGGAGTAKMTMTSDLKKLDNGATEVVVNSKVDIAGRIVQFGRGMVKGVSEELFKQFATSVRENLEPTEKETVQAVPAVPAKEAEPIKAIPLFFKVLFRRIAGFFKRLFGGGKAKQMTDEDSGE